MAGGKFTRREFLKLASIAGGGLALAAHAPRVLRAASGGFNWRRFAGTRLRVITLKFPISEIQQERLSDFEKLTGIRVQWEMLPEDQWRQKVKVEHLAGSTDLDSFLSYWGQEGLQFQASGWYADMKPYIEDSSMTNPDFNWEDYTENLRHAALIEGGIPIIPDRGTALPILYYRRDLFKQFNLEKPKTWDDVMNAARTIHKGTNGQVFGIVLRGKAAAATSMFAPVLYDLGGKWFDRNTGDVAFNTPESLSAFEWWGRILRDYGPPGSVNNHWAEVVGIFSQGRAAMCYDDIVFTATFSDPEKSAVVGKVGFSAAPRGPYSDSWRNLPPYQLGVAGLAISGFSKNKGAAWHMVQ